MDGGGAVGGLDQLPFGPSNQLGQLILGAAQNFNADNPQFDMNFFAPVFGGDEVFGDEEMFLLDDSDSDSFAEEEEASQIFISLADSHNIRRLSFHKKVDGVHKLPKVAVGEFPCYEELHRLLEEVELLCKVKHLSSFVFNFFAVNLGLEAKTRTPLHCPYCSCGGSSS